MAHWSSFWVAAALVWPSSAISFWLSFWLFGSDMGVGRLEIKFQMKGRKIYLLGVGGGSSVATTTVGLFSGAFFLLFWLGQVWLGLRFPRMRCLNTPCVDLGCPCRDT